MKYLFGIIALSTLIVISYNTTSADVGDAVICHSKVGTSNGSTSLASAVEAAQTFTTPYAFVATGVKLPVYDNVITAEQADVTFTLQLFDTVTPGSDPLPDYSGGALASVTLNTADLPDSTNTAVDQTVECDSTVRPEHVFEFSSPVSLNGATAYAIVVQAACASACANLAVPITSDTYADGNALENGSAFNEAVPTDWSYLYGSETDSGFVVYGNVVTPPDTVTVDSWILSWIDTFGFNSPMGKLLIAIVAMAVVFLILIAFKIPMIFAMAISGMSAAVGVAITIIEPWMILAMIAIVGLGAMFLVYRLIAGGSSEQ
jgi:hypothetical protein